jgi:hypothetical protein
MGAHGGGASSSEPVPTLVPRTLLNFQFSGRPVMGRLQLIHLPPSLVRQKQA